jgi:hypothetical protein
VLDERGRSSRADLGAAMRLGEQGRHASRRSGRAARMSLCEGSAHGEGGGLARVTAVARAGQ